MKRCSWCGCRRHGPFGYWFSRILEWMLTLMLIGMGVFGAAGLIRAWWNQ